jgi:hypothetical protein
LQHRLPISGRGLADLSQPKKCFFQKKFTNRLIAAEREPLWGRHELTALPVLAQGQQLLLNQGVAQRKPKTLVGREWLAVSAAS